eukprot:4625932-Alexandrium_andersonii.AAC.1
MSASLVGSEMCIRDSPCPAGLRSVSISVDVVQPGVAASDDRHRRRGPTTVSYTHLTLPTICSV